MISISLLFSTAAIGATRIVPVDFPGAKQPQVALATSGDIDVTFGRSNTIYFTKSTNNARTFFEPVPVAVSPKLALGMRRGPRIALTKNSIAITAVVGGNLLYWISTQGGKSWSNGTQVNDQPQSAREGLHAMTASSEKVFCAWLDLRNGQTELWGALSHDQGLTWEKNHLLYHSPDGHICECCHPSALFTPDGKLVIMWRNWLHQSRDLYWAASADDGKTFSTPEKLGTSTWPLTGCPMDGGGLAAGEDGGAVSIWRRRLGIFMAYDSASEKAVTSNGSQPVIAAGANGLYCLWQQGSDLIAMSSDQRQVRLAQNAAYPALAPSTSGGPVAVWESNGTIWAEKLDAH